MSRITLILEKQWIHGVALVFFLPLLRYAEGLDGMQEGEALGISSPGWFRISIALAVLHQTYVWFCWRTQLHCRLFTRLLGRRGFSAYAFLFAVIGCLRGISVIFLAMANQGTLSANRPALRLLALAALVPGTCLLYSVGRYFTFKRALGLDHFDDYCRQLPLVRKGIFRHFRNGMYLFGFLLFWVPALWFASRAALFAALFNHLYIWVHYFSTELPDMRRIYGDQRLSGRLGG